MSDTVFIAEKTAKGLPAMWESGGGLTNTGKSIIVCGANFEPLVPVYVRQKGMLACANHALFVVSPGYHIIEASHHREDFDIFVHRILWFDIDFRVETEIIGHFTKGEWHNIEFLDILGVKEGVTAPSIAIEATVNKAKMYHCREMVFGVKNG